MYSNFYTKHTHSVHNISFYIFCFELSLQMTLQLPQHIFDGLERILRVIHTVITLILINKKKTQITVHLFINRGISKEYKIKTKKGRSKYVDSPIHICFLMIHV